MPDPAYPTPPLSWVVIYRSNPTQGSHKMAEYQHEGRTTEGDLISLALNLTLGKTT